MENNITKSLSELDKMVDDISKSENVEEKEEIVKGVKEEEESKKEEEKEKDEKDKTIEKSIISLENILTKSSTEQTEVFDVLIKSITAVCNSLNSVEAEISSLSERFDAIESKPQVRKSISNINMQDRDFNKSSGMAQNYLSKSEIASILTSELLKGNPLVQKQDIVGVESGMSIRPELQSLLNNKQNNGGY